MDKLLELESRSFYHQWRLKDYQDQLNSPKSLVIGVLDPKKKNLISALVAQHEQSIGECWLLKIMTDGRYRGRGVASFLVKKLEKNLENQNILLEVNINNHSAISFYQKNNFQIIAKRPGYYPSLDKASKNREDALIMQKAC